MTNLSGLPSAIGFAPATAPTTAGVRRGRGRDGAPASWLTGTPGGVFRQVVIACHGRPAGRCWDHAVAVVLVQSMPRRGAAGSGDEPYSVPPVSYR